MAANHQHLVFLGPFTYQQTRLTALFIPDPPEAKSLMSPNEFDNSATVFFSYHGISHRENDKPLLDVGRRVELGRVASKTRLIEAGELIPIALNQSIRDWSCHVLGEPKG